MKWLISFNSAQTAGENRNVLGGKGAVLAELFQADFPVPDGFVVKTEAFDHFLKNSIQNDQSFLTDNIFLNQELRSELRSAVRELGGLVAVRSSANIEDQTSRSFAGLFDSFLAVGEDQIEQCLKKCWLSAYSRRARAYAGERNLSKIKMAVVFQTMVEPDFSGVAFSLDPVRPESGLMVIESVPGLNLPLVQGEVDPDRYYLECSDCRIKKQEPSQHEQITQIDDGRVKTLFISDEDRLIFRPDEFHINKLGVIVKKLHTWYNFPVDIEWALLGDQLFILQVRPITNLNN